MRMVADYGEFEPEVMTVLEELLTPESVALDVGANIGVLSLVMAKACTAAHVYAFEPGREAAHYLRANVVANGLTNVVVEEVAVLETSGHTSLQVAADGSAWSFISSRLSGPTPEDVQVMALDDWMQLRDVTRVDLIKLDIESCEVRALAGATRLLERFRPIVIAEYNPLIYQQLQGESPTTLYRTLRRYAHHVYALVPGTGAVRLLSQRHLDLVVTRHALVNLLASPRPLPHVPGEYRQRLRALRHFLGAKHAHNARRHPERAFFTSTAVRVTAPETLDVSPGTAFDVNVDVTNQSPFWISDYRDIPMFCGHRWFTTDNEPIGASPQAHALPPENLHALGDLRPGGHRRVVCRVTPPSVPGDFVLRLGLVQTKFVWIDDIEPASGCRVRVRVR